MTLVTRWSFKSNGVTGTCCWCWRSRGLLINLAYRLAFRLSSCLFPWRCRLWWHLTEWGGLICLCLHRSSRRHFLTWSRLETILTITRTRSLGRTPIHCRSISLISNSFHTGCSHEVVHLGPWLVYARDNSFLLLIWFCLRWRIWPWFLFLGCWWCLRWCCRSKVVLGDNLSLLIAFLICWSSSCRPVSVPAPGVRALLSSASSLRGYWLLRFSWRSSSPLSAEDISALGCLKSSMTIIWLFSQRTLARGLMKAAFQWISSCFTFWTAMFSGLRSYCISIVSLLGRLIAFGWVSKVTLMVRCRNHLLLILDMVLGSLTCQLCVWGWARSHGPMPINGLVGLQNLCVWDVSGW